jgi:phosphate transport system protein
MPRTVFEREMKRLEEKVAELGAMVEKAITRSVDILKRHDAGEACDFIASDDVLNQARFTIERDVLVLIATQQPMAGDLRTLAAILEIAGELERIGDYAKGIGKLVIKIGDKPHVKPLIDLPRMADKTRSMVHAALKAFFLRDVELARAIPLDDEEVDALYDQIFRELMTYVIAKPEVIEQVNYLIWAAHNLERAADRAVNICERVIFTVTGEVLEFDGEPPKRPQDG